VEGLVQGVSVLGEIVKINMERGWWGGGGGGGGERGKKVTAFTC
jgi:hypothetical protein